MNTNLVILQICTESNTNLSFWTWKIRIQLGSENFKENSLEHKEGRSSNVPKQDESLLNWREKNLKLAFLESKKTFFGEVWKKNYWSKKIWYEPKTQLLIWRRSSYENPFYYHIFIESAGKFEHTMILFTTVHEAQHEQKWKHRKSL